MPASPRRRSTRSRGPMHSLRTSPQRSVVLRANTGNGRCAAASGIHGKAWAVCVLRWAACTKCLPLRDPPCTRMVPTLPVTTRRALASRRCRAGARVCRPHAAAVWFCMHTCMWLEWVGFPVQFCRAVDVSPPLLTIVCGACGRRFGRVCSGTHACGCDDRSCMHPHLLWLSPTVFVWLNQFVWSVSACRRQTQVLPGPAAILLLPTAPS